MSSSLRSAGRASHYTLAEENFAKLEAPPNPTEIEDKAGDRTFAGH
jgi:hypothetical protein